MKTIVALALAACACSAHGDGEKNAEEKIVIHLCGEANKPGKHLVPRACNLEELEKAVGGWTEFGSGRSFHVIRFPRKEGAYNLNDLRDRKQEILQPEQLEKKDGRFVFLPGDIIYLPVKAIGAR